MKGIKVSESRYKQCGATPQFSMGQNPLKKILRKDWHIPIEKSDFHPVKSIEKNIE